MLAGHMVSRNDRRNFSAIIRELSILSLARRSSLIRPLSRHSTNRIAQLRAQGHVSSGRSLRTYRLPSSWFPLRNCEMSLGLQHRIVLVDQLMEKLHLPILIEIAEDGRYIVSCPLFNGCHPWGETIDEATKNISEVIEMCLEETKIENLNAFVGFREREVVRDAKASYD